MKKRIFLVVLALMVAMAFVGCGGADETSKQSSEPSESKVEEQKELLIYCGVTMVRPMTEIAKIIEEQENCKITIEKGGSGGLLNKLKTDKTGDLYLPGSDSYINTLVEEEIIKEHVLVGYNKAAIFVQKGNPLNITSDLENFTKEEYMVVIGNPESGSIGKETKKILDKKGIFEKVVANASKLTNDSTELLRVIKDKEVDLVINWYATSVWDDNPKDIDVLQIDEEYAKKKKLVVGLLKYSENPELAKIFMDYASSDAGKEIFNKYGLYDIK
ncbi:MAG: molybdate ABC transporter substrate-binding protein [Marinisporobacter sp.]|jgi:molybdate transport system substrate-binding protein|nr:molybdate ABC transporter substrate-binding protein [Marinisporobacter sp.]